MPGTATLSSGYTSRLINDAAACDRARILQNLREGTAGCCASAPSSKSALYASILEQRASQGCPLTAQERLLLPRAGVSEGVRIQRVQTAAITCSTNPLDPLTRFSAYTTFVPQAPCPGPTAEQLNSTQPSAPLIGCQPSRFY